jgi:hypothetical protein
MSALLSVLCAFCTFVIVRSYGGSEKICVIPTGIDIDCCPDLPTDYNDIFGPLVDVIDVFDRETPIQFRLIMLESAVSFSAMAMFEEKALDFFARVDVSNQRRRCSEGIDPDLFALQRRVSFVYSVYYGFIEFSKESAEGATKLMLEWGLDPFICDAPNTCDSTDTPWGLGYAFAQDVWVEFGQTDGWNADGKLSRTYNAIPYQDFRDPPYTPVNDPWTLPKKTMERWQPLLETDDRGFLFNQEHVVPQIGFSGRSVYLGDDYYCATTADEPDYDYYEEIPKVLKRMADLSDAQKVEIEVFDNKLRSIVPLFGQYMNAIGLGRGDFMYSWIDISVCTMLYEATQLVWKEKVRYDRVRPPSITHKLFAGQTITSYAGTDENGVSYGTQTFLADDWEPYIRTMPHAEYPSASACVCEGFAELMRFVTGSDDFTQQIGGPLRIQRAAFTSLVEPGSTPAEDVTLEYSSWSEISEVCGRSRLDGGMHFDASVPAGAKLCREVGVKTAEAVLKIINGERPDYVVDLSDKRIVNRQCDKKGNADDRSKNNQGNEAANKRDYRSYAQQWQKN